MSSDYRPRGAGGSSGSSSSSGGGRRRRGGRGRSGGGSHGHSHSESRVHTNGGTSHTPKKKEGIISKFLGLFKGKKKDEPKHTSRVPSTSRPDFKERTPGAERTDRAERPRREDRPPKAESVPQEITSPKLYVGNLAYEATEGDLHDLFSKVGLVKNVEVAMDRHSQRSKGFGFVEMESLETAKDAAAKLNRTDFMSRQIVVSGAKVDKRVNQAPNPRDEDPTSHDATGTSTNPDATA
jgi:RNA recognition motif-containing protein